MLDPGPTPDRVPPSAPGWIASAWRRWTEPSSTIEDPLERARARALTRLFVTVIPFGLLAITAQLASDPAFLPTFATNLATLIVVAAMSRLTRTRHYRAAATTAMVGVIVACCVAGLLNPADPVWWAYSLISVVAATILLPLRATALLGVGCFLAVGAVLLILGREGQALIAPLGFLVVMTALLLLLSHGRNLLEQERLALLHALEQSRRLESVGRIAGGVAHDFNNLLMVVRGSADALRRDDLGREERQSCFEEIEGAAAQARRLTHQLLTFAHHQESPPETLDVVEVTRASEAVLRTASENRLDVVYDVDRLPVQADQAQLEQVLLNLVVNARDATRRRGAITLQLDEALAGPKGSPLEGQACARVSVIDTGEGMTPEVVERVFEPFFSTGRGGFGLGLATVSTIVTGAGGAIDLASTTGEGTTFRVFLPLRASGSASTPARAGGGPTGAQDAKR